MARTRVKHRQARVWRRNVADLRTVARAARGPRRLLALRMLELIEAFAASQNYDAALAVSERLIAMIDADEAKRRARVRRGLLMLRAVAWLALVLVLGAGVLLASR
jgi:hypothetical protein